MTTSLHPEGPVTQFLTRSWLVIPAGEDAALYAGARSGADVLLVDLASLAPEARPVAAARTHVFLQTCRENPNHSQLPALFVLLPPINDHTEALLETLTVARPDGFALAGSVDVADIQHLDVLLGVAEAMSGLAQESIRIAAFLSHPPAHPLGGISRRLVAIGWSAEDLARLLGATRMHGEGGGLTDTFRQARAGVLLTASIANLEAIDAASGIFSSERLARDCAEAAADGFTGKAAWSPRQVSAINHAFSPTAEQLAEAKAVLAQPAAHDIRTVTRSRRAIQRSQLQTR